MTEGADMALQVLREWDWPRAVAYFARNSEAIKRHPSDDVQQIFAAYVARRDREENR